MPVTILSHGNRCNGLCNKKSCGVLVTKKREGHHPLPVNQPKPPLIFFAVIRMPFQVIYPVYLLLLIQLPLVLPVDIEYIFYIPQHLL